MINGKKKKSRKIKVYKSDKKKKKKNPNLIVLKKGIKFIVWSKSSKA